MFRTNLLRALVFAAIVGVGSLHAGELPEERDCSDYDHSGCALVPGATTDTCNEWAGAASCRSITGAPASCDVVTVACTAAGCAEMQTVTCEFSGTYMCDGDECGSEGGGGGQN